MTKSAPARGETFTIGGLAKRCRANIETIRYYERIGLLKPPPRTPNGRRVYGYDDLRALVFIRRARELGFSLEVVRTLLQLSGPEPETCGEVRDITARHLEEVRSKLSDLARIEKLLASTVSRCADGTVPECAVLDILDIDRAGTCG